MDLLRGQVDDIRPLGQQYELLVGRHWVGKSVLHPRYVFGQHVIEQHHLANGTGISSCTLLNSGVFVLARCV